MKKLLLIAAVLLAACSTWVHPDPYRKLSADKSACSREVLSYLPRPDVLSYTYEELQIARTVWKIEFDKEVRGCLRDKGWEKQ